MAAPKRKKKPMKKSVRKSVTTRAVAVSTTKRSMIGTEKTTAKIYEPVSPSVGAMVKWYENGWRYGTVLAMKPRKRQIQIGALGPRKAFWIATGEVEVVE